MWWLLKHGLIYDNQGSTIMCKSFQNSYHLQYFKLHKHSIQRILIFFRRWWPTQGSYEFKLPPRKLKVHHPRFTDFTPVFSRDGGKRNNFWVDVPTEIYVTFKCERFVSLGPEFKYSGLSSKGSHYFVLHLPHPADVLPDVRPLRLEETHDFTSGDPELRESCPSSYTPSSWFKSSFSVWLYPTQGLGPLNCYDPFGLLTVKPYRYILRKLNTVQETIPESRVPDKKVHLRKINLIGWVREKSE